MNDPQIIQIIGAASGIGAGDSGCATGPLEMMRSAYLRELALPLHWQTIHYPAAVIQGLAAIPVVAQLCLSIAKDIHKIIHQQQQRFLLIGGDQACSLGTWRGACCALQSQGELGLIWIDAHMDAHTPQSSPTGNVHGMPLAALMGYGDSRLTELFNPKGYIKPENVCLIGIRSYETSEAELLEKLGVKIFFMDEVDAKGIAPIIQQAHQHVTQHTAGFGVSIDLDGFDPSDAPAVGTPVTGGIKAADIYSSLNACCRDKKFIGAEIVEFNPHKDIEQQTEKLIGSLIQSLFVCE